MAKKKTGLGRGIGALIPSAPPADRARNGEEPEAAPLARSTDVSRETSPGDGSLAAIGVDDTEEREAEPSQSGVEDVSRETPGGQGGSAIDVFFSNTEQLQQVPGARLIALDPQDIRPNPQQPRRVFDEEELAQLEHSIREFGVFQPIVVRRIPDATTAPHYELIMGERRLRATRRAGLAEIPAIVRETEDEDMLRDALLENLHRAQLNPLEEASAYQQLIADFGITQEQLSERIGRSRSQISNTIRLLRLPESVQQRVAAGVLSAGHARAILSAGDAVAMEQLADKIVNEDLSVRAAEAAAADQPRAMRSKPRPGGVQRGLDEIAERLSDRLDARVRVRIGRTKGQIVIDFPSVADLNRILRELGERPFGDSTPV